jgi:hypothetical protein
MSAAQANGHGRRYHQTRSFTAAATVVDQSNRTEAQRLKKLKQSWQEEAWEYRDAIGELRYATTYLGNAARRMVLVPSAYVPEEINPIPLTDIEGCPPAVMEAAADALNRLAVGGQVALGGMLRDITENFEVAGECYLIGTTVPATDTDAVVGESGEVEVWDIRSISEVDIDSEGRISIKQPGQQQGEPLPADAFCSRLWWPHPRRKALADSPFKAILDTCEELLILSRDIRASGRSRLANSGLLLLPDTLTVVRANTEDDANAQETGDEFFEELMATAMAAIQDEGSASAILPIVVRGPADAIDKVRQVTISRPDVVNADKRQELITRMATGLDLPAEVLTGKSDLNHWTAWQVSDDTFRHHIEPIVQVEVDALTLGYYRPELLARKVDPEWVSRIVLWYDPTNLVTHPDRTKDALDAWDRIVISDEALRDYMGFSEEDAPEVEEILDRMVRHAKTLDPTIQAQIVKRWDPSIDTSEAEKPQQPPQINLVRPEPGAAPPPPQAGRPEKSPQENPADSGGPAEMPASGARHVLALPSARRTWQAPPHRQPTGKWARQTDAVKTGSKKLNEIDRDVRTRAHQGVNDQMRRALERTGAKVRTKLQASAVGRQWLRDHGDVSNFNLSRGCMAKLPSTVVAAAGLDEQALIEQSWDELSDLWSEWLDWGDDAILRQIAKMTGIDVNTMFAQKTALREAADEGFTYLRGTLGDLARAFLTDSATGIAGDTGEIAGTSLVDMGVLRRAIAYASGANTDTSAGLGIGDNLDVGVALPQLSTGPIAQDALAQGGLEVASYTWQHGFTPNPFQPHEDLDGVEFGSWTDEVLQNDGDFPDVDYFMPGDHDGCSCDYFVNWASPEAEAEGEPG